MSDDNIVSLDDFRKQKEQGRHPTRRKHPNKPVDKRTLAQALHDQALETAWDVHSKMMSDEDTHHYAVDLGLIKNPIDILEMHTIDYDDLRSQIHAHPMARNAYFHWLRNTPVKPDDPDLPA